ncbi:acyl dehydratase [Mycobacteroides franklinii]|uniref:Acyl dehydratase n=1 Tax=Mycobacteroides franklinii TaxID=948102 RepID=A0A4R8R4P8_9MYCO|nr:acyl dehydratase [Mycobacteroides franklinii]TDZ43991.1 hypothetical protein CCUG64054_04056 [Mycobacteroides franklinii]TDZ51125.1 hypothetical protein CCUG63697_02641 [Mycobacteroides franklinii]TDZ57545.1 hypothetical protein CCUG63696_04052 [Mycobacteroides franklinii]TDZ64487.1 hypothetical protein CCUG63695_03983 [Mycobacteroides franklinii]TDZ70884.1 hypothetical protein CCUG64056_04056 [Mycobacteroides franklinii]
MKHRAEGPYFEELEIDQVFDDAPGCTLTAGRQAVHQAIVGDRLQLPLDDQLATVVAGGPVAHPAFVWDVAIGQSTVATHHVKANLFYRNLMFHRIPLLGDTLRTVTRVVGLRENGRREGRRPTGLVALRMTTEDQDGRVVLDFYRCAMLPLRSSEPTGRSDDLSAIGSALPDGLGMGVSDYDLSAVRSKPMAMQVGESIEIVGGDVVSSAPELARLTLNIASVHHDHCAAGRRLVYGGHTIGLALSQVTRAFPGMVFVLGWHSCDHLGPVREGDTLRSVVELERVEINESGGSVVHLRSRVVADGDDVDAARPVLDWRFVALLG